MKKILSLILAVAMITSCFAGTMLFVFAKGEERLNLNTEYAWSYPSYLAVTGDNEGKALTDGDYSTAAVYNVQNQTQPYTTEKSYYLFESGETPNFYVQNDFGFPSKLTKVELAFNTENEATVPKSVDILISNDGYNFTIYPAQKISKETVDGITKFTVTFTEEIIAMGIKAYVYTEDNKKISFCELSVMGVPNENERILLSKDATYEWTGGNAVNGYGTDDGKLLTDGYVAKIDELAKFAGKTATATDDLSKSKVSQVIIDLGEEKNVSEVQLLALVAPSYIVARYSLDGVTYEDFGQSYEMGRWGTTTTLSEFAVMRNHTVKARYIKVLLRGTAVISEVSVFGSEKPIEEMDYGYKEKTDLEIDTNISHLGKVTLNGAENIKLNDKDFIKTYNDLTQNKKYEVILEFSEKQNYIEEIMVDFQRNSTRYLPKEIKSYVSYNGQTFEEITEEIDLHLVGEKGIYRQYLNLNGVKKFKFVIETASKSARITEIGIYSGQPHLPLYRGGFIQLSRPKSNYETGNVKNTEYMWYIQLKGMKDLGMEYVVMQHGADFGSKVSACNAPRLFEKGYTKAYGYGCEDPFTAILKAAEKLGMKVFLGSISTVGSYDSIMEAGGFKHTAQVAADGVLLAQDIYDNYSHFKSFAGYYYTDETCDSWMRLDSGIELYRSIYIPITRQIRKQDPDRKIMISPAIWRSINDVGAENLLYNLVKPEATGERHVDIVAAQDCLGREEASSGNENFAVTEAVYKSYESCVQGWKRGVEKAGVEFWIDAEVFEPGGWPKRYPDTVDSMEIGAKFTNNIIVFDIAHYFTDQNGLAINHFKRCKISLALAGYAKRYYTTYKALDDASRDINRPEITHEEDITVLKNDNIEAVIKNEGKIVVNPKASATSLDIKLTTDKAYKIYADAGLKKEVTKDVSLNEQITRLYAVVDGTEDIIEIIVVKEGTKYNFADLKEGAWYIPYVETATVLGIIRGSEVDGKTLLKPEDKATRIEGVIFALRMLGIDSTQFSDEKLNFADYNADGEWSANYVKAAVALGLMKGSEADGKLYLNGNNSISRQEFFAIFARAMQITDKDESYKETSLDKFVDKDKIAPWFVDNIKYLVHNKIVDGNPDGKGGYIINPEGQILRCEIIKMVTAALTK